MEKPKETTVNDDLLETTVSPPDNFILNFFCSSAIDFEINLRLFLLKWFLLPLLDRKKYLGLTPLEIKSEIDDLIIFFIIRSGLVKFIYVYLHYKYLLIILFYYPYQKKHHHLILKHWGFFL